MVCFSSLEVFEAKENKIDDLIELEMCATLTKLNLRDNLIKEDDNIFFVASLNELKYINLNGNPIQKNENYKKLIQENLIFIEKIDIDEIETQIINTNQLEDLSQTTDNTLNFTSESNENKNKSKINSTLNFSETSSIIRTPSSNNTLNSFYKKDNISSINLNKCNNIFDNNQMTKTNVDWYHKTNYEIDKIDEKEYSNKKVLQGIRSILSNNRRCLNDISINDLDISQNSNENSYNEKKFNETARNFPGKFTGLNPIKINNIHEEKSENIVLIKKPIIFKTSTIQNNSMSQYINTKTISNANSFIKFKKEPNQITLKPLIIKKIKDNEINDSEKIENSSMISNTENKIIFKNKPIIMKTPSQNNGSETASPKKNFINPIFMKVYIIII